MSVMIASGCSGKDYNFKKAYINTDIDLYISAGDSSASTVGFTSVYFVVKLNNSITLGTYPSYLGTCSFNGVSVYFSPISSPLLPVEITKMASKIGDYYEGNINSVPPPVILDGVEAGSQATKPYTIKGSFKLKRTN